MLLISFSLSKISFFSDKIAINYLLFPFFYGIYAFIRPFFWLYFVFLLFNDDFFENMKRYKKDGNQRLRDFIFVNYYSQIGITKEISYCFYCLIKRQKKDLLLLATTSIKNM